MVAEQMGLQNGERVVVHTPDRHQWRGRLVGTKEEGGRRLAVVRLDSGWVTTYPLSMVKPEA
jgi:hypothetical protein